MRAIIYARCHTNLQSTASINNQIRKCRDRIENEGWILGENYTDSDFSNKEAALQSLLQDAMHGKFDVIVVTDLDRLSRSKKGIRKIFKRIKSCNVKVFTVNDGFIQAQHIGLKSRKISALLEKIIAAFSKKYSNSKNTD